MVGALFSVNGKTFQDDLSMVVFDVTSTLFVVDSATLRQYCLVTIDSLNRRWEEEIISNLFSYN